MYAKKLVLENGQYWEASNDEKAITLTRFDGGYEQYKEEHDTQEELESSMQEIAPLEQWREWTD